MLSFLNRNYTFVRKILIENMEHSQGAGKGRTERIGKQMQHPCVRSLYCIKIIF